MNQNNNDDEPVFYKYIKLITFVTAIATIFLLIYLGDYINKPNVLINDIRTFILSILVGLVFSFLLTIKEIREFLLKSASIFMTDGTYLKKLSSSELKNLKESVMNEIHGTDIVSNKESLFNHLQMLDKHHSIPHKSIVNEKWIFENFEEDIFKLIRVQDYRIHTLDRESHSKYNLQVSSILNTSQATLSKLLNSIKIKIKISSEEEFEINVDIESDKVKEFLTSTDPVKEIKLDTPSKIDDTPITINDKFPLILKYTVSTQEFSLNYKYEVSLVEEFTQIHILTERIEEIEYSQAIYSSHATYGLNYDITLPNGYKFVDIYHSNTLDLEEEQVNVHKRDKELSININGWQLPGLIFVYTYKKEN